MHTLGSGQRVAAGVILGLALPTLVSIATDNPELFGAPGFAAAILVGILALVGLTDPAARLFALGALLGTVAYYPFALFWAAGRGMSLGG